MPDERYAVSCIVQNNWFGGVSVKVWTGVCIGYHSYSAYKCKR